MDAHSYRKGQWMLEFHSIWSSLTQFKCITITNYLRMLSYLCYRIISAFSLVTTAERAALSILKLGLKIILLRRLSRCIYPSVESADCRKRSLKRDDSA